VKNIIRAVERTFGQVFDRAFLKVFSLGIAITLVAMIATWFLADYLRDNMMVFQFGWQWVNDSLHWLLDVDWIFNLLFFLLMGIFFPPIATIFMSLFLDDIIDAVEEKYYPNRMAGNRIGNLHLLYLAVRLAFMIVLLNILVIPLYIIFFWTGFVPLAIFYILNSYLLGWGYYEMVAVRHLGVREAGRHRTSIRGQVMLGGAAITLLYMVPLLNLAAPILGVAILTHMFHLSFQDRPVAGEGAPA